MCQSWGQHTLYMLYDIIVLKPSTMFHVTMWSCDHYCECVIWYDLCVTVCDCDITLTLTLNPRIKKRKRKRKLNKKARVQALHIWQIETVVWLLQLIVSLWFIRVLDHDQNTVGIAVKAAHLVLCFIVKTRNSQWIAYLTRIKVVRFQFFTAQILILGRVAKPCRTWSDCDA